MNEAIANYARAKVEKNEDSGVESANSLDNTGEVDEIFGNILCYCSNKFIFKKIAILCSLISLMI